MNVDATSPLEEGMALARVAACVADPARARILCCLMDGCARTATELACVAEVATSTASAHLTRLREQGLLACVSQGKHRYYRLANADVAAAVEALLVLVGRPVQRFEPNTPKPLRQARRCYDHLAGTLGVQLHDLAIQQGWLQAAGDGGKDYLLTAQGEQSLKALGVDVDAAKASKRRRLACACLDWSERRPHLGGAVGAAWLRAMLDQKWLQQEDGSRVVHPTRQGLLHLKKLLKG